MTSKAKSIDTYDTLTVCIGVIYCLSILFIQLITEIASWLLRRNNSSLPKPLAMNPSPKKKGVNSTLPKSPTQERQQSRTTEISTAISTESCVASGLHKEPTTVLKTTTNLQDGTMSQTLKTSKSGPTTRAARPRRVTKSNTTTQTPGLGFSV